MEKRLKLKVEGMFCAHCSKSVSDCFDRVGIKASVNLAKNEVSFIYDDEKVSLEYLKRLVRKAGYGLVLPDEHKKINMSVVQLAVAVVVLILSLLTMIGHMAGWHHGFFGFLHNGYTELAVASLALLVLGLPFGIRAVKELKFRKMGMDFLVSFASSIAYALSVYTLVKGQENYFHSVSMILSVIAIGHYISDRLKALNGRRTAGAATIVPKRALVRIGTEFVDTDVDDIEEGDLVKVLQGALVPVDGYVESETAVVDEQILTGESRPREAEKGGRVYAASVNVGNPFVLKASASALESVFSGIVNESYALDNSRGRLNRISDTLAGWFVPFVILIAVAAFFINRFGFGQSVEQSLVDAVAVLVVSCPCAFGLAVPLASLNGYYLALKNGVLFKSGDTFERVKRINKIYFDKTGTLTTGALQVVDRFGDLTYLSVVKTMEQNSTHPLAKSILSDLQNTPTVQLAEVVEEKGKGLQSGPYRLGSYRYIGDCHMSDDLAAFRDRHPRQTVVYLAKENEVLLALALEDTLREDAVTTIAELQKQGIEVNMLTGDERGYALEIARLAGLDPEHVIAGVSPQQKGEIIESTRRPEDVICFVGDGINDLLALQRSDLSIAMPQAADIAVDKAEVRLLKDSLRLIPLTVRLSRHVYFNIIENFGWAFVYNAAMIPLAVLGRLTPTLSSVLMIISNITLILNSLRIRLWKGGKNGHQSS